MLKASDQYKSNSSKEHWSSQHLQKQPTTISKTALLSLFTETKLSYKVHHCMQVPHSSPLFCSCWGQIVIWHKSKQNSLWCGAQPFWVSQQDSVDKRNQILEQWKNSELNGERVSTYNNKLYKNEGIDLFLSQNCNLRHSEICLLLLHTI